MVAVSVAAFSLAVALGLYAARINFESHQTVYTTSVLTMETLAGLDERMHDQRLLFDRLFISTLDSTAAVERADTAEVFQAIHDNTDQMRRMWSAYLAVGHETEPREMALIVRFEAARARWFASFEALTGTPVGPLDPLLLVGMIRSGEAPFAEAVDVLDALRNYQSGTAHGAMDEAGRLYQRTRAMLLALALVGGGVLVVMLYTTTRRVREGLAGIEGMAGAIAEGRFDQPVTPSGDRELDGVMDHLLAMRSALLTTMTSLKRSEAKSQAVLRTMRDGVVQMSTQGIILAVNDIMTEIFGYEESEMVGRNVKLLMPEPHASAHDGYLARYKETRKANILHRRVELNARRKDGSIFPIDLVVNEMVDDDGSVFVGVIRDISEQKATQRDLVTALKAATTAAEAKSAFLAKMSHEIRTPINAVIGFALLAQRLELTRQARSYFDKIYVSAQSLLTVINDILDLSKIEAGKLDIETIPFRLSEALDQVYHLLNLKARSKGIELVVGCMPDVPDTLMGDPNRLAQILTNLAANAVKFTEHGHVSVMCRRIEGEPASGRVMLEFSVDDTGIGIPTDKQSRLFQSFSQVDESTSRKFGGTGLGLVISKALVEGMGGHIDVASEAGRGARFWFRLPLQLASDGDLASPDVDILTDEELVSRELDLSGKRVLVIDDNSVVRMLMTSLLAELGCNAEAVASGEAALEKMTSGDEADFVTIDWSMPGMDGFETARRLRALGYAGPICLVTGLESELIPEAEALVDIVLPKPVTLAALHQALSLAHLGRQRTSVQARLEATVPDLQGCRILVVDDNEFNREIASELLRMGRASVDTANDGEHALRSVAARRYDLVFMDVQMPVMDGYDATRAIRIDDQNLPIIALTAHAMKEERDRVLAAGMNDLLTKPIDHQKFFAAVRRWLPERPTTTPLEAAAGTPATPAIPPPPEATQEDTSIFDRQGALSRVGGDPAMLERFMQLFWQRNAELPADIGAALNGGDTATARRLAHALKGGAGTVGLVEIQHAADALEKALDADASSPQNQFEAVMTAWKRAQHWLRAPETSE